MSEKKWSCKWSSSGRRSRTHKGKEFPRHTLQYFDGTHLGMRKRIYSKSTMGSVWRDGRAALNKKYIIGLLNKYVGKPYKKLKFVYDLKTKNLRKKYNVRWNKLEDYLHKKPEENPWRESFYVDDEGIIRKVPQKVRHYRTLTKRQWDYNKKVKLPDFGPCIDNPRYAVKKRWGTYYEDTRVSNVQIPKLLGTFWVNYNGSIFKIPIWTCNSEIMQAYKNHCNKQVPFHLKSTSNEWIKKAIRVVNEWIPIDVYGLPNGQSYMMRFPNISRLDIIKDSALKKIAITKETDPLIIERLQKSIEINDATVEKMPVECLYDMGYGKFYTFMKRSDYEHRFKRETM